MDGMLKAAAKTRQDKLTVLHIINIKNDLNELSKRLKGRDKEILDRIMTEVAKI